jgi:hypothetical protein
VYPWLRLIGAGFSLIGAPKVGLLSTTRIMLRAWPNDLDINLHVNNGRYLSLADIGRIHWFSLTGLLRVARRARALPVVGGGIAHFSPWVGWFRDSSESLSQTLREEERAGGIA